MIKTIARIYEKKELWGQEVARDISLITDEQQRSLRCVYYGEKQPREFKLSPEEIDIINREIISIFRYIRTASKLPDKRNDCMNRAQEKLEWPIPLPSERIIQLKSLEYDGALLTTRP